VDHIICDLLGACVASTREGEEEKMEKEKWNGNAQGKGITLGHFISPVIGV
jgi:hypothetical protein